MELPAGQVSTHRPRAGSLEDDTRQLALLIQSVTDYAIYMLDAEGYIQSWNPGGQRIKGYSSEQIIGQHFSRFYTPEDADRGEPARGLRTALAEGKYEAEGWRLRRDGTRFWASVVIDPIWQEGKHIGFAKITRDITERHEAQLRLQVAREALAQSQKIEAIGKLTFGIAHDFNNLLTVITNSLDLIGARPSADLRTLELVETALRASDRGALLTRQLLAFARGQSLAPERHDVNDLLQHSMELYRRACGATVQFVATLGDGLPPVEVDTGQFEAAVLNLVANSRDAMPKGGTIALATKLSHRAPSDQPEAAPRDYVCVAVTDNGEGMPAEVTARAFEPFYTTKEIGKGSGLGLSQVFGFAAQSGGFATLASEVDQGTVVSLCLPALGR